MQRQRVHRERPRRGSSLAVFTALGLATACLNPDISDEAPLSESMTAFDVPDAGEPGAEETSDPSSDTTPEPSTKLPQPSITRRTVGRPSSTRR